MPKMRLAALILCAVPCLAVAIGACTAPKIYDYEQIKQQYADSTCPVESIRQQPHAADNPVVSCDFEKPMDLKTAIAISLSNNPENAEALARIAQAAAAAEKAHAALYPNIGVYTEYLTGDAPSAYLFKRIDQRKLPPNVNFNYPGSFDNFESGINFTYNLYNGGKDRLTILLAEVERAASRFDLLRVKNYLTASVIETFYNALAAREFVGIAKESVSTIGEELRIMKVRYKGGGALKSDLLSLEVRLAQAKEALVQNQNRYDTAVATLATILGLTLPRPITPAPSDLPFHEMPDEFQPGLVYALDHRPELQSVRQKIKAAEMRLDLAKADYKPRVDLQAKYYLDDPDMAYDLDRDNWTAAVLLNWNVFTGFSTRADIKKARAAVVEALATDKKTLLSVELEVKTAYLQLTEARARLEVAQRAVASAEESLKLVSRQYEGGSATVTRYLEAELDRNQAKSRVTAAFYDLKKATANIGRAVGYWSANLRRLDAIDKEG